MAAPRNSMGMPISVRFDVGSTEIPTLSAKPSLVRAVRLQQPKCVAVDERRRLERNPTLITLCHSLLQTLSTLRLSSYECVYQLAVTPSPFRHPLSLAARIPTSELSDGASQQSTKASA